jgi:hypothetical protein
MKKLLLTSALVGSLVSGISAANAATTVSGNLAISYVATSNDTSGATSGSHNGFGNESQINLSASGDLNNGMKYAAGFSWEIDGSETLDQNGASEGTYIEFITGGTTIGIGADRADVIDGIGANYVGYGYSMIDGGPQTSIVNTNNNEPTGNYGFNIRQDFGGGNRLSFYYAPNAVLSGAIKNGRDIHNGTTKSTIDGGESAYNIVYTGKLGGANIKAGYNQVTGAATYSDRTGSGVAADYTIGKTKFGASYTKTESTAATGTAATENTTYQYGIAQAISDTVSVGLTYVDADTNTSGRSNETVVIAAVGYNLGPVSVQMQYKNASDMGGVAGSDATSIGMYVGTKF